MPAVTPDENYFSGRIFEMHTRMMLGLVLVFWLPAVAVGQTWDGGSASTNNWNDGNNWSPNAVPANDGTATPNFAGSTRLGPVVNVNFDVRGVTFDNAAGAFTISSSGGALLALHGDGITNNNSSQIEVLSVPLVLATAQTWGGAGPLTIAGTVALGSNQLTVNSPATVALTSTVGGSGSIVKNGTGAVVFNGSSTFSGGVTLNEGVLAIGINAGLGTGSLTINGGSVEGTGGQGRSPTRWSSTTISRSAMAPR